MENEHNLEQLKRKDPMLLTEKEVLFLLENNAARLLDHTSVADQTRKVTSKEWNYCSTVWRGRPDGTLEPLFYVKCHACIWAKRYVPQSPTTILKQHREWHERQLMASLLTGVVTKEATQKLGTVLAEKSSQIETLRLHQDVIEAQIDAQMQQQRANWEEGLLQEGNPDEEDAD